MRRSLFAATGLLIAWGALVELTGGVDTHVFGVAVRSRDPSRALLAGLACGLALAIFYRSESTRELDRIVGAVRRRAAPIAAAIAVALAVHATVFGCFSIGGADSYGYVNQAYDWASRRLPGAIALPRALPFPASDQMLTPLGYRAGQQPHTMVPTYAVGLPLIMAATLAFGPCGPFFVVPIFAALFVWFAFLLGRRAVGSVTGVLAATIAAASPPVLYQALWAMSDIPSAALWTGAAVASLDNRRGSAALSGICTALGILVRPNLAPLAIAPAAAIAGDTRGRERWARLLLFAGPLAISAVLIAILNARWYGAPWISGYGSAGELYAAANIWPNAKLYSSWLWQSESPWVVLAVIPLLPGVSAHVEKRSVRTGLLLMVATLCCYLPYAQFEVWWYLRFMLPAFGVLAVLIAAGLAAIARTMPQPFGRIAAAVAAWLLITNMLAFAASKQVFGPLRAGERRYIDVGEFVARSLPTNAALLSMQHSGSLRFYSGRLTLRYEWVQKEWAKDVPAALERAGYHPFVVIDDWEMAYVRQAFGLPDAAGLPWPLVARMRELGGVTIFDLATSAPVPMPVALEPGAGRLCSPRQPLLEH